MNTGDIEKLNLVNKGNRVTPNYDLSGKEVFLELHIGKEKELCIIGRVDNNYICWCSLTCTDSVEQNEAIFDYVANSRFWLYTQEYKALGTDKYEEVQAWYTCAMRRTNVKGMLWETPFGVYYSIEGKERHGKNFSVNIRSFFYDLLKLCDFRVAGQAYEPLLAHYLEKLRQDKDQCYYLVVKPLISLLEKEAYLRVCPDEKIRVLYLECMKECSHLYNRYMTAVR